MFTNTLKLFSERFNLTAHDALTQSQEQLFRTIAVNYDEDEATKIREQLLFFRESHHVGNDEVNSMEFDRICTITSPADNHVIPNQHKLTLSICLNMDLSAIIKKLSMENQIFLGDENLNN